MPALPSTHPLEDDKLREECGVFAIAGHPDAAALTALGLHALQHRGQEATGIVTFDGARFHAHRALGLIGDTFGQPEIIGRLKGSLGIGHNRYATTGETILRNVQPLFAEFDQGGFALAHNGNLTNAVLLRRELVRQGAIFQSTTDTEAILHLMAQVRDLPLVQRLAQALQRVVGAYSLVAIATGQVIGVRDPLGVRPLLLGKLGDGWVLASESCAFDIIGAEYVRDVEPGEMVVMTDAGIESHRPFGTRNPSRFCVFEYVYFARPDSVIEGRSVYNARRRIGVELAHESPVEADVIVPVPDSGVPSALGFSAESGIPFELGIIRNHYVGRTFIEPTDQIRHFGVKLKHNANRDIIAGKRVVLVDDSIVRGTTSKKIVELVRQAGAREVHVRISSPPTKHSCFYGIDTPEEAKLLAHEATVEEMASFIGADSLAFVSMDGLYRAMGERSRNPADPRFCDACFSGAYPTRLADKEDDAQPQLSLMVERA